MKYRSRIMKELQLQARLFAALGFLLLVIPILLNTLPRPSDEARQYIAALTGISICAQDLGSTPVKGNPAPSNPCENSVGCAACPTVALASDVIIAILEPFAVSDFKPLASIGDTDGFRLATAHAARAPPFSV